MTVFELTQELYQRLLNNAPIDKWTTHDIREKLGVMYYTKEINPPYFFAFSFSIGVYLPFLSPIVFPPMITLFTYLKLKIQGKPKKVETTN